MDRVNVDTDQMVPKQFCKLLTREGYGRVLFYDWRYFDGEVPNPQFVLNFPKYKSASVLLARANFACGSSREHAAWAVLDYGFRAVIAPSFGDIFYNNCFKNGLLPLALSEAQVDELFHRIAEREGYSLTVDLETQTVSDGKDFSARFEIDPFRRDVLLKGLDDIAVSLQHENEILRFESSHHPSALLFDPAKVDVLITQPKK